MIDPFWEVIDLDPVTWRNLGPLLAPQEYFAAVQPGEHGLFVLHDHGRRLKVVDTEHRTPPADIPDEIDEPRALARKLYALGQWDRVHVIDKRHLAEVARQAQATARRDLALDEYYHLVHGLIWGEGNQDGYVCVPPRLVTWHGWTYAEIKRFVAELPSPSTVALGVFADGTLSIGLILVCSQGMIRRVTTFEGLLWHAEAPEPSTQSLEALCEALETQFAPPAAVLLCSSTALFGWRDAQDKLEYLQEARDRAQAYWYLAGDNAK